MNERPDPQSSARQKATEGLDWGLVHEVVEPDSLLALAREHAAELAAQPGEAVGMTKRLLHQAVTGTLDEQLELERQLQQAASEHPAYADRVAAFLTKQPSTTG